MQERIYMKIASYIINDIAIQPLDQSISNLKSLFNELTYTHVPIIDKDEYIGCISENDARCFEKDKPIKEYYYAIERFFALENDNWLDILEKFANHQTNIMPILQEESNTYLGYIELADLLSIFNETPFLHENGVVLVVEKGFKDYSFSEISRIIESNEGNILGILVSNLTGEMAQITIKIGLSGINEIIQTFRRYGYKIKSTHQEDAFLKNLKERSDYLNKYLNI